MSRAVAFEELSAKRLDSLDFLSDETFRRVEDKPAHVFVLQAGNDLTDDRFDGFVRHPFSRGGHDWPLLLRRQKCGKGFVKRGRRRGR